MKYGAGMKRIAGLAALWLLAGSAAHAQVSLPAAPQPVDSAELNTVTTFSVKSGRIALSSAANPGPVYLPDGAYTNDSNLIIVILEGRISRIQTSVDAITEISSVRLSRNHIITLTPSTSALMAVTDIALPSGIFKSEDGATSFTIVAGRPIAFTLAGSSAGH